MSLNIKNEHVHDMVRRAAELTGKSQTSVVEEAVAKLLAELEREHRRKGLDQSLAAIHAIVQTLDNEGIAAEALYDPVTGLPA